MESQETTSPREEDWLVAKYADKGAKDACTLAMAAVIHIAKECCAHPLSLEETQDLLETVWYEMDQEQIIV